MPTTLFPTAAAAGSYEAHGLIQALNAGTVRLQVRGDGPGKAKQANPGEEMRRTTGRSSEHGLSAAVGA
jgi:hypothetical protein